MITEQTESQTSSTPYKAKTNLVHTDNGAGQISAQSPPELMSTVLYCDDRRVECH